jgi:hypothetical protein
MSDRPKHWHSFEELVDLPIQISFVSLPVEVDFVVEPKTAREIANRRWRMEQIAFGEANDKR